MKERYPQFVKQKRICLILLAGILFSLCHIPAEAQLSIGAKGGITVSSFSNTSPHTTVTQGFDIGFFLVLCHYRMHYHFSLKPICCSRADIW